MFKDVTNNHCFVHIPGTAGSVILQTMHMLSHTDQYKVNFEWFIRKDNKFILDPEDYYATLESYDQYEEAKVDYIPFQFLKHQPAKYNDDPDLKLYTIIRNPYDRLLVDYHNLKSYIKSHNTYRKGEGYKGESIIVTRGIIDDLRMVKQCHGLDTYSYFEEIITDEDLLSFKHYAKWLTKPRPNQLNWSVEKVKEYVLKKDQYSFTHDDDGKDLIDYYIRYENVNKQWNVLASKLNYPQDIFKNFYVNWTASLVYTGRHYSTFYDDETKELVDPLVYRDCKTFDYQFEWK